MSRTASELTRATARLWPHDRAHFFFSGACWDPDALGLAVARLVAALLVPAVEPVTVAIDDTLFRRRGKRASPVPRTPLVMRLDARQ